MLQCGRDYVIMFSGTSGKALLRHMLTHRSTEMPARLAEQLSLKVVRDDQGTQLQQWCREAIEALPSEAQAARAGNTNVINKILGQVMKLSRGRVDAQAARTVLLEMLQ